MNRLMTAVAASAMLAAFSLTAVAQNATTRCIAGEGQILEYDIAVDDGVYKFNYTPRIASSDCVQGQPGKVMFRGVSVDLKTESNVRAAISAADQLVGIGLTDPAEIKKLLDRVTAANAANAKVPQKQQPVAEQRRTEPFNPFGGQKK